MVVSLHGSLHQNNSPQPVFTLNSIRIRSTVSTVSTDSTLVHLVHLVQLVQLVHLVQLVQ